ncbi:VOC family protein [Leptospira sarikeiensis]|uniref:Glyoxalase n=1 Tax=Leptospira sarikeiensis TaxID=2484943 RepID=A0A4R9K1Q6_9LEPT|nr:VOC family protein [Leptospira sarikeiensis]TGL59046.1 glyoxalase [Leptospira sarikeiensis]
MIHHIAIATEDPKTLKEFYMQIPGLDFEKDHVLPDGNLRSSWFLAGSTRIMIEKENVPKAPHALIFSANTKEEKERLDSLFGNSYVQKTEYSRYFLDPDGNRLGFSSFPEPWN